MSRQHRRDPSRPYSKAERHYNVTRRYLERVADVYARARSFCRPHTWILEQKANIPRPKVPAYWQGYMDAKDSDALSACYRDLEWHHSVVYPDGTRRLVKATLPHDGVSSEWDQGLAAGLFAYRSDEGKPYCDGGAHVWRYPYPPTPAHLAAPEARVFSPYPETSK